MNDDFDDLLRVLDEIRQIVHAGRPAFDKDVRQRWARIGIRNVYSHYTPRTIDYDRVWFDATSDIERVIAEVRRRQRSDTD